MRLEIVLKDGRWLVNGKRLHELNQQESAFMSHFFREVKLLSAPHESQEEDCTILRQAADQTASINYSQLQKETA